MLVSELVAKHLLILCCYGGSPFVDIQLPGDSKIKHKSTYALDPTDWIAVDTAGAELNSSLHPDMLAMEPNLSVPVNVPLKDCDLFNLTFTNIADEHLFDDYKGSVRCRCPLSRSGTACEFDAYARRSSKDTDSTGITPFILFITITTLVVIAIVAMRCGLCDCFGPFRSPFKKDELDAPLDENTVNRCLELVRAHEARQNNKFGEHNRPLIATVSEGCSPYNTTVEPCDNPLYHSHSPPPSYR
uniref:EGF-like domain-containing protein n=1 Tax=Ascaris lumbricoides TaxID=6252 RepID=A0A0M3INW3_ASCLU